MTGCFNELFESEFRQLIFLLLPHFYLNPFAFAPETFHLILKTKHYMPTMLFKRTSLR